MTNMAVVARRDPSTRLVDKPMPDECRDVGQPTVSYARLAIQRRHYAIAPEVPDA
jgi:hypothetical protein